MAAETKNTKAFYNTEIPSDWKVEKSGLVLKYFGGNAFSSDDACTEGVKWLKIANVGVEATKWNDVSFLPYNFIELHKKYLLKDGDVVMALTRPILDGKLKIAKVQKDDEPCLLNQRVAKLIPKGSVVISFLYYFLQTPYYVYMMEIAMAGTDPPNIGNGDLEKIKIPIPPLPEQRAIAQVLSTADTAIHTTEKIIAQKELRKKWLMQQLLTGKKQLKGFGGEWKEKKLSDIFERVTRKNTEGNTTVVTISAQRGFVRQTDFFNKNIASEITDNYFLVEKGEFCYNKSYSNGYPWGATKRLNDFDKAVVTTLYICFGVKNQKKTNPEYFEQFFGANHLDKGLTKIAHEGGRAHGLLNVTPSDFFSLKITVPSYEEQTAIAQVLQAADKEISLLKAKAEKLREQKKGLMQVLLTGKIRLKYRL